MQTSNPDSPPPSPDHSPEEIVLLDRIRALPVSWEWKSRFNAIVAAGGVKLPNIKTLPSHERDIVLRNAWALFFGPFYYCAKGMWKKGSTLFLVSVVLCVGLETAIQLVLGYFGHGELFGEIWFPIALTFFLLFGARANIHYYRKMVLDDCGWW